MTEPLSEDELAGLKALLEKAEQDHSFLANARLEISLMKWGDISNRLFDLRHTITRLLHHIDALKAERWEPIETAPKDGTPIIAYCVHTNAKYATNSIQEGWEYPVIAKWIDHNGGGWTWHGMAGTFTHWRPLPAPPSSLLQR